MFPIPRILWVKTLYHGNRCVGGYDDDYGVSKAEPLKIYGAGDLISDFAHGTGRLYVCKYLGPGCGNEPGGLALKVGGLFYIAESTIDECISTYEKECERNSKLTELREWILEDFKNVWENI